MIIFLTQVLFYIVKHMELPVNGHAYFFHLKFPLICTLLIKYMVHWSYKTYIYFRSILGITNITLEPVICFFKCAIHCITTCIFYSQLLYESQCYNYFNCLNLYKNTTAYNIIIGHISKSKTVSKCA